MGPRPKPYICQWVWGSSSNEVSPNSKNVFHSTIIVNLFSASTKHPSTLICNGDFKIIKTFPKLTDI